MATTILKEKLRLSRFVHIFNLGKVIALYHSLSHEVIYLLADQFQIFLDRLDKSPGSISQNDMNALKENLFLVPESYNEKENISKIRSNFLGSPAFRILYLLLTDYCNLRCSYCHIENAMPEGKRFSYMQKETAKKALDLFSRLLLKNPRKREFSKPCSVIFYGGEPLLNKEIFIFSIQEIQRLKQEGRLPKNLSIILITNGTLLDEDVIKTITLNNVSVSLSIDGPQDIHDANRIFTSGSGTFQKVLLSLRRLKRAGVNVSISCTINLKNLKRLEEVFLWIVDVLGIKGLGFNMLVDLPGKEQADEEYVKIATEGMIKCYEIARKKGVYEDRMMRKVSAFVRKNLHLTDCAGCGNQIVVDPDGKVGPCQAYLATGKYFSGHVDDLKFDPFSDPVFLEWSKRFNIEECLFCEAVGLCGGGCPYNSETKFGSIWKIDPNFCIHSKKILKWLLSDLFCKTLNVERR